MRYRVLHDWIGPRLTWPNGHDREPVQQDALGKDQKVEAEELGDQAAIDRLLGLGAIEPCPSYPEGHEPAPASAEKPLSPPAPDYLTKRPEGVVDRPQEPVAGRPAAPPPPGSTVRPGPRKPAPPTGRDVKPAEKDED